tara:strand:+ start:689 stop:1450 length:762 start_codon:yes stop_codon:yes gene_type:complete
MVNKNLIIYNNKISYILKSKNSNGPKISVVFLCGYRSDKSGTKAIFIENLRKKIGFEYLRFDYSGHGHSSGDIESLLFSNWVNESKIIIEKLTNYPLLLIGSSMGGWISFYISIIMKREICGIIGIATAADFTVQLEKEMTEKQSYYYKKQDILRIKSEYSKEPYVFTKKFIANSKKYLILKKNVFIKCKSSLLYGLRDSSVSIDTQIKLLNRVSHKESSLTILKNSDHRMSSRHDLKVLKDIILNYIKYPLS